MVRRFTRTEEVRLALTGQFRDYTIDRVAKINLDWIALEKNPDDAELAEKILRSIHGLKGEAHIMGFADVSLVAHRTEELLIHAREGSLALDEVGDLLLAATDAIAALVQRSEEDDTPDVPALLKRFDALIAQQQQDREQPKRCSVTPSPQSKPLVDTEEPAKTLHGWKTGPLDERSVRVELDCLGTFAEAAAESVIAHTRYEHSLEQLRTLHNSAFDDIERIRAQTTEPETAKRLEALRQLLSTMDVTASGLAEQLHEGNVLARELEHQSRGLRVMPIVTLFGRYARAARELAAASGKRVVVAIDDDGIRVDHAVVDKLAEPILHLIRNSVDHGIETPEERRRVGKSDEGSITLGARLRQGSIVVTVADDGRGINYHKVRERAQELGWLDDASPPDHVLNYIFRPGFTTRSVASQVSGRGVGLDVVKRNVEMLGGVVRASSLPGKETRFELQVPSSITLSRVLVIRCGQEQYALPGRAVVRVAAVSSDDVENLHDRQVIRHGTQLIPLVGLASVLDVDDFEQPEDDELRAVIVKHEASTIAFVVSNWVDDTEVVVKPHPILDGTRIITGATVLQDGGLALVLNPPELLARALGEAHTVLPTRRDPKHDFKQRRILLVEDQTITRAVIARMLRALEHDVLEACDGEQALEVLKRETGIDLVLTDIDMPLMNGIELIRQVRMQSDWQNLPIVVLSTHGTDADKRRALEAGADDYLVKTDFSEQSLRVAMDRRLGS